MDNERPRPEMFIVAGAPGSGKSTLIPVASFGVDYFNADDHAAERNAGSYHAISQTIRDSVNLEFAAFINDHIHTGKSFAVETTLRSNIALKQAADAHDAGFLTEMFYIATEDVSINLRRIIGRAKGGGHSASEKTLRSIYARSYQTLPLAINAVGTSLDRLTVFDNSRSTIFLEPVFQLTATTKGSLSLNKRIIPAYLEPYCRLARTRI